MDPPADALPLPDVPAPGAGLPARRTAAAPAPYRPPAPYPKSAVRSLISVVARGERNLLSLLPSEAYRMRIGRLGWSRRGILLVNDPVLVAEILRDPEQMFPKNDLMVGALEHLVGHSMFVSSGEAWKRQRRMIDPAFSHMRIDRAFPPMLAAVDDHIEQLRAASADGAPLSLDKIMSRLTADIVCRAIFSTTLDSAIARSVFDDFLIFERSCANVDLKQLLLGRPWASIAQPEVVREACLRIRAHIGDLLDACRAKVDPEDDIVQAILRARDPDTGEGFSREELIDQLGVFFLAGHETTASALTWAFFVLAMQPALAQRILDECAQHRDDGELRLEQLRRMGFTRNVFREALRLYPPITFIPRVALRDTSIGGFPVRRGNMIMIAPWSLHRHADLWRDPDCFDPDRFVAEDDRAHAAGAYIPFGLGPRVCVGAAFANMEATLILARLTECFALDVVEPRQVRPAARLTTRPEREIMARFRAR